ncbi:hypothetical protein VIGAN_09094300 [Vigna angularis var. angularis]|uniref:Uncharacterized protein n=1 Tax=Vigna angularis var. angularis TaxID=157739 RepID=A0A0S3SXA0_PHAAN|nr:hypothetical protein VIGAN_09094300 [Vigna angularis var. angularis]
MRDPRKKVISILLCAKLLQKRLQMLLVPSFQFSKAQIVNMIHQNKQNLFFPHLSLPLRKAKERDPFSVDIYSSAVAITVNTGTGWRRAFCTRDPASTISDKQPGSPSPSPSPRSCARLGFLSGGSNPSTPRLRCTTTPESSSQTVTVNESPRVQSKNTSRTTKSPKTLAVSRTGLVCPVCNATWKDVPLLAAHKNLAAQSATKNDVAQRTTENTNANVKKPTENTSLVFKTYSQVETPPKHTDSVRSYDDDEPLLSPTSGGRIIPIPEADENVEEDDEEEDAGEFQGFSGGGGVREVRGWASERGGPG